MEKHIHRSWACSPAFLPHPLPLLQKEEQQKKVSLTPSSRGLLEGLGSQLPEIVEDLRTPLPESSGSAKSEAKPRAISSTKSNASLTTDLVANAAKDNLVAEDKSPTKITAAAMGGPEAAVDLMTGEISMQKMKGDRFSSSANNKPKIVIHIYNSYTVSKLRAQIRNLHYSLIVLRFSRWNRLSTCTSTTVLLRNSSRPTSKSMQRNKFPGFLIKP